MCYSLDTSVTIRRAVVFDTSAHARARDIFDVLFTQHFYAIR